MTAHPSLDLLSEFLDDALPPGRIAPIGAHLDGCAECQYAFAALSKVRATLRAEASATPAMPPAVSDRLTAALTAEARSRASSAPRLEGAHAGQDRDVATGRRTGAGTDRPASTAQAGRRDSRRPGRSGSRRTAGSAGSGTARAKRRGGLRRVVGIAAAIVGLVAVGGIGYNALVSGGSTPVAGGQAAGGGKAVASRSYTLAGSEPTLTAQGFDRQVTAALKPGKPKPSVPEPSSQQGFTIAKDPRTCIQQALAASTKARLIDYVPAHYDRQAAYLAITAGSDSGHLHAYVVSGCEAGRGRVVHDARIALPR